MATPRLKASGKWEITLRHPSLPRGRKAFSFDSQEAAAAYSKQWNLMKQANLQPPAELLEQPNIGGPRLGVVIQQWINSGLAAPSQLIVLKKLSGEVGDVRLGDVDYSWLSAYVQRLKVDVNLAPNSLRHRVQALARAIDEYLRHNPKVKMVNPVKLLPKGYSTYTERDQKLVVAAGKQSKQDVQRDRRLHPGEEERIVWALSGEQRSDRERALLLSGGNALLTMFTVIVYSGLRLKEAYMLRRGNIDLINKVMKVQCSKQWRGKVVFRDVPIRQEVYRVLTMYLSTRLLLPAAPLFPFMDEEPGLSMTTVSKRLSARFTSAFEYADCVGLHEHDLRHEATCRWLELRDASGNWMFRSEEINKIMGWAPGSTMAQRYASFRGSDLAQRIWATTATTVAAAVTLEAQGEAFSSSPLPASV